jgi:hypothetical protein
MASAPIGPPGFFAFLRAALVLVAAASLGCSVQASDPPGSPVPLADVAMPAPGVADRGADPGVVAIEAAGQLVCAGSLVAPSVVLTALHCLIAAGSPSACGDAGSPPGVGRAPPSLQILVGDLLSLAEERARGQEVIAPAPGASAPACGEDVAALLLDTPIDGIRPFAVRATGAARGDPVRTVGYGRPGVALPPVKIARDHLPVLETSALELRVAEPCGLVPGGPAIDETSGEIVGIASRADAASCGDAGAVDVYVRADTVAALVAQAVAASGGGSAGATGDSRVLKGPLDLGANCSRGADCAAGVCVTDAARGRQYCTRTCDAGDRCPARYRCRASSYVQSVCVAT